MELTGGGFATRGAVFPGVPFVLIGRGPDFAWSATSSQADNIDLFVETLCAATTVHYLYHGQCQRDAAVRRGHAQGTGPARPAGLATTRRRTARSSATRRSAGSGSRSRSSARPVGASSLARRPSTTSTRAGSTSAKSFVTAMNGVEFSFNWFYADDRDIAYFSSGRLPIRAPGTDPALPTIGTGDYDWRGFVPLAGHAQAIDPRVGDDPELEQQARRGRRRGRLELLVRLGPARRSPAGGDRRDARSRRSPR